MLFKQALKVESMEKSDLLLLAINRLPEINFRGKRRLASVLDTEDDFLKLPALEAGRISGFEGLKWNPGAALEAAENDLLVLSRIGGAFVYVDGDLYPPLLNEMYDSPFLLFYRGMEDLLIKASRGCNWISIVGTRQPSYEALEKAYEFASVFAENNIPVVSGLAYGIDSAAHRGAVEAGRSVAVLPSGIDSIYPRGNSSLAGRIMDRGGLLVSEYPPESKAVKWHFPQRNRIISALSRGVVIVEAPEKSGALITVDFALQQNRDVFVAGEKEGRVFGTGCEKLAGDGAVVISTPQEVIDLWNTNPCWSARLCGRLDE